MEESDIMSTLAHAVLAATSTWALYETHGNLATVDTVQWVHGTFVLHIVHGVVGVVRFVAPNRTVDRLYDHSTFLSTCFAVPCLVTHIYRINDYSKEVAWLHVGFALIPFISHYSRSGDERLLDTVLAGNLISMGYLTVLTDNYLGLGAAIWYAVNFFVLGASGDNLMNMPALDGYTYGLALFNYLAVRGLGGKAIW